MGKPRHVMRLFCRELPRVGVTAHTSPWVTLNDVAPTPEKKALAQSGVPVHFGVPTSLHGCGLVYAACQGRGELMFRSVRPHPQGLKGVGP